MDIDRRYPFKASTMEQLTKTFFYPKSLRKSSHPYPRAVPKVVKSFQIPPNPRMVQCEAVLEHKKIEYANLHLVPGSPCWVSRLVLCVFRSLRIIFKASTMEQLAKTFSYPTILRKSSHPLPSGGSKSCQILPNPTKS